jgi:hypothetical protein
MSRHSRSEPAQGVPMRQNSHSRAGNRDTDNSRFAGGTHLKLMLKRNRGPR